MDFLEFLDEVKIASGGNGSFSPNIVVYPDKSWGVDDTEHGYFDHDGEIYSGYDISDPTELDEAIKAVQEHYIKRLKEILK